MKQSLKKMFEVFKEVKKNKQKNTSKQQRRILGKFKHIGQNPKFLKEK